MTRQRKRPAELPLFSWAWQRASAPKKRRAFGRRALALGGLGTALALTIAFPPRPFIVWNASASAPLGLYRVGSKAELRAGDMVIARMPERYRLFAARRRYLPANVPLVKRIAAAPGDEICASGRYVLVNGRLAALRRSGDRAGRMLPWWSGCLVLRDGAHMLLMDHRESFDGRYFGPTARDDIIGETWPLWTE